MEINKNEAPNGFYAVGFDPLAVSSCYECSFFTAEECPTLHDGGVSCSAAYRRDGREVIFINKSEDYSSMKTRITESDVQDAIFSEHFFTAANGRDGALAVGESVCREMPLPGDADLAPLDMLTFCVLVLKNGFVVYGVSACAHASTFDSAIGRELARKDAVEKIWPLLGFLLKDTMSETSALSNSRGFSGKMDQGC